MRMQEPEQEPPYGQQWQASQESSEYRTEYPGRYEPEQQQKIYPRDRGRLYGTALGIVAIILSSIGFVLTVAGIVASALVLKYANGQHVWLAGGAIALAASIVGLLVCVAIFVIAVVVLALRTRRAHRRMGPRA